MTNKSLFDSLQDISTLYPQRRDYEHILSLPSELGPCTKLHIRNGKLLCETFSGITIIVHKPLEAA